MSKAIDQALLRQSENILRSIYTAQNEPETAESQPNFPWREIMDHSKCGCSTGIHESLDADGTAERPWGLTYGQGGLDEYGYWNRPCYLCARMAEKRDGVAKGTYWPWIREMHGVLQNESRHSPEKLDAIVDMVRRG